VMVRKIDEAKILKDIIWNEWVKPPHFRKPKMDEKQLYTLALHIISECKKRGIDPTTIDWSHILSKGLSYWENKEAVDEFLMVSAPSIEEITLEQLENMAERLKAKVIPEKRYKELLRIEEKAYQQISKLEKKLSKIEEEKKREKEEFEKEREQLLEEVRKAKPVKIRLLEDFPPWLKAGQVISTRDFPWVLKLLEEGKAEMFREAPPTMEKPLKKPLKMVVREVIQELKRLAGEL